MYAHVKSRTSLELKRSVNVPKGDNVVSGAPIVVRGCGKEQPEARSGNSDRVGYECGNGCEGDDAIPSHFCSDCKL